MSPNAPQTVLVVDDDRAIRTLVQTCLERDGYGTLTAASGDEALELLQEHGPDISLLLTDVVMPGIDGLELAQRVRQIQPRLPVVVMSAFSGQAHIEEFEFISKPFIASDLLNRVRQVLTPKKDAGRHRADGPSRLKSA